jgi:hypothetical protein
MKVDLSNSQQVMDVLKLKPHSVYLVLVKHRANNPTHKAILFTGFPNGGNSEVYCNNYEEPYSMMSLYSIKIVKYLTKIKD